MPKNTGGMPARRLCAALAFAAATATGVPNAFAAEAALQPGTFGQIDPATKRALNPGNSIVFVRGKNGRLSFSLNAIRALDLNQGFVAGTLPAGGASVTWVQKVEGMDCKLTFTAAGAGLKVVQDIKFGDCGFGYGVLADGTYVKLRDGGALGKPPGP